MPLYFASCGGFLVVRLRGRSLGRTYLFCDVIQYPPGDPQLLLGALGGGHGRPCAVRFCVFEDFYCGEDIIRNVQIDIEFGASSLPQILQLVGDSELFPEFRIVEKATAIDDVFFRHIIGAIFTGASGQILHTDSVAYVLGCEVFF